jgi:hypothetical protein
MNVTSNNAMSNDGCDAPFYSSNSFEQIEKLAWKLLKQNPNWRYGQAVFNAAYELFPNEANDLRATPLDCFYRGENVAIFLETMRRMLNKEQNDAVSDTTGDDSSNADD